MVRAGVEDTDRELTLEEWQEVPLEALRLKATNYHVAGNKTNALRLYQDFQPELWEEQREFDLGDREEGEVTDSDVERQDDQRVYDPLHGRGEDREDFLDEEIREMREGVRNEDQEDPIIPDGSMCRVRGRGACVTQPN